MAEIFPAVADFLEGELVTTDGSRKFLLIGMKGTELYYSAATISPELLALYGENRQAIKEYAYQMLSPFFREERSDV